MNFPKRKRGGFTLIELLVVIAIIGILASIVLVSFPGATKKANDSRVISAIGQARTVMEYVCTNEGCSAFTCTHADMTALCAEIKAKNLDKVNPTIAYSGDSVCIASGLNSTAAGAYYCADRTGKAGYSTSSCPSTGICVGVTSP